MGLTWVLSAPGGLHVGAINLAIWDGIAGPIHKRDTNFAIIISADALAPTVARQSMDMVLNEDLYML